MREEIERVWRCKMREEIERVWDYLVECGIATDEELRLATYMNGYTVETLNSVIYVRTGYHDMEQLVECEGGA